MGTRCRVKPSPSSKAKPFEIKYPPAKPIRINENKSLYLYSGAKLKDVLTFIQDSGGKIDEAWFEHQRDWRDDPNWFQVVFPVQETEEAFQQHLEKYQQELQEYNTWCEDNREILEKREQARAARERRRKLQDKKRLERELLRLERELG